MESLTELKIKYCRLADGNPPRYHADWCELVTGLWHSCDCYYGSHCEQLGILLYRIKNYVGSERHSSSGS